MASKWAFVDESKSNGYHLVAVVVHAHEAPSARRLLRELTLRGQRRIHFRTESSSRRNQIIAKVGKLDFEVVGVISRRKSEVAARRECLLRMLEELAVFGVSQVSLEQDLSMLSHDKQTLHLYRDSFRFTQINEIRILEPHLEPLLWLADIAAWTTAKGDMSLKAATLIEVD
ncbi:MAG: hypothetical protein RL243_960 [Actinomycetota bacterium]|jgi:hypothetical protein